MNRVALSIIITLAIFTIINFIFGTQSIQKLQQELPGSFACVAYYSPICEKSYGFDSWLAFLFIPLLTVTSAYFSRKERINPLLLGFLVMVGWVFLLELFTRLFHIPSLYHSLERSSLHYSIFFVQSPLTIYSGGIIISDQLKMLFLVIILSLFTSYIAYKLLKFIRFH